MKKKNEMVNLTEITSEEMVDSFTREELEELTGSGSGSGSESGSGSGSGNEHVISIREGEERINIVSFGVSWEIKVGWGNGVFDAFHHIKEPYLEVTLLSLTESRTGVTYDIHSFAWERPATVRITVKMSTCNDDHMTTSLDDHYWLIPLIYRL